MQLERSMPKISSAAIAAWTTALLFTPFYAQDVSAETSMPPFDVRGRQATTSMR